MKKYITAASFLFLSFLVTAGKDEMKGELAQIFEHYQNLKEYSMQFHLKVIDTEGQLLQDQKGEVIHTDRLHYVNFRGNITLRKEGNFVSVNLPHRFMLFATYEKIKKKKETSDPATDIKKLIDSVQSQQKHLKYSYRQASKGLKSIFIEDQKNKLYKAYTITFDVVSHRITSLVYYLRPSEEQAIREVHIDYLKETAAPRTKDNKLKISHYVKCNSGNCKPSVAFSGYEFSDQTKN